MLCEKDGEGQCTAGEGIGESWGSPEELLGICGARRGISGVRNSS